MPIPPKAGELLEAVEALVESVENVTIGEDLVVDWTSVTEDTSDELTFDEDSELTEVVVTLTRVET